MTSAAHSKAAPRIYYGWIMVAGLAAVSAVMTGMGAINLGLFIKPMGDELGIGQTFFGFAQTARLIGFSATSFYIGRLLDRHGARLPLVIAALVTGFTVVGLGAVSHGWQIVLLVFISGMTGLQGFGGNLYATVPFRAGLCATAGRRSRSSSSARL